MIEIQDVNAVFFADSTVGFWGFYNRVYAYRDRVAYSIGGRVRYWDAEPATRPLLALCTRLEIWDLEGDTRDMEDV